MDLKPLPLLSGLQDYKSQAEELLSAHRADDSEAIRMIHHNHPRFLDSKIPWLAKNLPDSEIQSTELEFSDAELVIARWYSFQNWAALAAHVETVSREGSRVRSFEAAVEAVIDGEIPLLEQLLREDPELVRARSTRVNHFDPPRHRATLLHYVGANGVEGYRQRTPPNAVEVAKMLLRNGAEVDALADMYGGQWTTMGLLVSSCHPANAGVQVALVDTMADFGARVDGDDGAKWGSPLMIALAFGYIGAAEALVRRGARVESLAAAAGLGWTADVDRLLPAADGIGRHRALCLAAQHGHVEIARILLDAGEDPNRYNPDGNHAHSTPLHQAALAGHLAVVQLLVERGARLDLRDTIYQGTPLGWAAHSGKGEIEQYLRSRGA